MESNSELVPPLVGLLSHVLAVVSQSEFQFLLVLRLAGVLPLARECLLGDKLLWLLA